MTKYRIKVLAQIQKGAAATIKPGTYEASELSTEIIEYQKKLKNLVEIKETPKTSKRTTKFKVKPLQTESTTIKEGLQDLNLDSNLKE